MTRSAHRLMAILAVCALLFGSPRFPAAAEHSAPDAPGTPISSVSINGAQVVRSSTGYVYTATIRPADATVPFTVHWEATGSPPADIITSSLHITRVLGWDTNGLKAITVTAFSATEPPVTRTAVYTVFAVPLPLSDVPADIRQRALRHLQEQRASGQSPEWAAAYLESAEPLFRPDMAAPAYYEFSVRSAQLPAGFIIVSAGEHDYPITNWATAGLPPSVRLRQINPNAVKLYKLDPLSYVGEDDAGNMVARRGDLPPKITGVPAGWLTDPPPIVAKVARPLAMAAEDPQAGVTGTITVVVTNPVNNPLQFEAWGSWAALKNGYASAYAPQLQALRQHAALEWQIERSTQNDGRILYLGQSTAFALIWPDPAFTLAGAGASLAAAEIVAPVGAEAQLIITATGTLPGFSAPLTATVNYSNGLSETFKVMIVHRYTVNLPLAATVTDGRAEAGTAALDSASVQSGVAGTLAADGFTYWYATGSTKAGADSKQAWYSQYESNCHSGCGATAWAMLIAWGDRQAAYQDPQGGNALWEGRWGLYRENGGRGADAVAPLTPDAGVEHITWEIADYIDTWCAGINDNGATWPDDMVEVTGYLDGRSGMQVNTWHLPLGFDPIGYAEQDLVSYARNVIQNPMETRRPTVIGIGFFSHYPLAYGYRQKVMQACFTTCDWQGCKTNCVAAGIAKGFYVNEGWGGSTGEWVAADLFFTGRLTPHSAFADDTALYNDTNSYFYFDFAADGSHNMANAPFGWPVKIRPVTGDFDRDGVLDDVGAYIYASDDAALRYDWKFDYNNDRTTDKTLDRWNYNADGWPVALDVDNDGWVDDIGIYIQSLKSWRWNKDHAGTTSWGAALDWGFTAGDLPVSGDFDRDGFHDDIALYSPSTGLWHIDYNHDGITDRTSPGAAGTPADLPLAGDFDHDGYLDDVGLYTASGTGYRMWHFDYDANAVSLADYDRTAGPYGTAFDLPMAGNFDTQ